MCEHISISYSQICEFIFIKARHFIEHRAFQVHNLIMGKRQNIIFAFVIAHGKCQFIMIIFSEDRIEAHIRTEIMHPAHIPFEGKAKSTFLWIACYKRPCSGFLCDHHCARIFFLHHGIQMTEKFDRIQIFIITEFIWQPLSVFSAVIQI